MKYNKLFIVGSHRSGTTWATEILEHHPAVITNSKNESRAFLVLSPFMKSLRFGNAWKKIISQFREGRLFKNYIAEDEFLRLMQEAREMRVSDMEKAEFVVEKTFDHFFVESGGSPDHILVEKTPTHVLFADKLTAMFPEAKVLEVVRDGRDVCASVQMRGIDPGSRKSQIKWWRKCIEAGLRLSRESSMADRYARIRYEDLKQDRLGEMNKIFTFAGLESSPELVSEIVERTEFKKQPDTGPGKFRGKAKVGNWREYFTPQDVKLFDRMAGHLLDELGYER